MLSVMCGGPWCLITLLVKKKKKGLDDLDQVLLHVLAGSGTLELFVMRMH